MENEKENMMNKMAETLNVSLEEVQEKFSQICNEHGLNTELENDAKLAEGLLKQWHGNRRRALTMPQTTNPTSGDSIGFGVIVAVEDAFDFLAKQRLEIEAECHRDLEAVFEKGQVCVLSKTETGYELQQVIEGIPETRNATKGGKPLDEAWFNKNMKDRCFEIEGKYVAPVDIRKTWNSGKPNFGYTKPLPATKWNRRVHFLGEVDGNASYYQISFNDAQAENFEIKVGKFIHIAAKWGEDGIAYSKWNTTETVVYNDDLPMDDDRKRDTSSFSIQNMIGVAMAKYQTPLVNLERYHQNLVNSNAPFKDRIVVTDGVVTNMNLNESSNGNRTLFLTDLNAEYDFEGNGNNSVPCWTPSHIDIDFGIGSNVLVIGKTSQGTTPEGELRNVSLNVFGLIVLDKRGNPVEVEDDAFGQEDWW